MNVQLRITAGHNFIYLLSGRALIFDLNVRAAVAASSFPFFFSSSSSKYYVHKTLNLVFLWVGCSFLCFSFEREGFAVVSAQGGEIKQKNCPRTSWLMGHTMSLTAVLVLVLYILCRSFWLFGKRESDWHLADGPNELKWPFHSLPSLLCLQADELFLKWNWFRNNTTEKMLNRYAGDARLFDTKEEQTEVFPLDTQSNNKLLWWRKNSEPVPTSFLSLLFLLFNDDWQQLCVVFVTSIEVRHGKPQRPQYIRNVDINWNSILS